MTESIDPATMYQQLQSIIKQSHLYAGADQKFEIVATTSGFAASYREQQTGALKDGIVLVHDIRFIPPFHVNPDPASLRATKYTVCVAPVRDGGPSVVPNLGDDLIDLFHEFPATREYSPGLWQNSDSALLLSSKPDETQLSQTFSTQDSFSFGSSVGFFGDTLQGSVSESVSVSWGRSRSIPDVSVSKRSSGRMAIVDFLVGEASLLPEYFAGGGLEPVRVSQDDFEIQLSEMFSFDDLNSVFPRSNKPECAAAFYAFDVFYFVEFQDYVQADQALMRNLWVPRKSWAWVSERIEVRQPPLSKPS